jgi:hypothetical protein
MADGGLYETLYRTQFADRAEPDDRRSALPA